MNGLFISFEGIEGTGKTSQARMLAEHLRAEGMNVVLTEEPGGTPISRGIRGLLLSLDSVGMDPRTELLLYNAARVQHIREVIGPALEQGRVVITDRFCDSTLAYQGYGRGIDRDTIDRLDAIATNRLRPDITFLIDIDTETGLRRNREARKRDRIEAEDLSFHERVRRGFLEIAAAEPERIRIIEGSGSIAAVHRAVLQALEQRLGERMGIGPRVKTC